MNKLTPEQLRDKKFYVSTPDIGFNPARNKAIIEGTIRKNDLKRRKKIDAYVDTVRERSEAVVSYLFSRKGAQGGNSVERYFGKQVLAYLRGQKIVEEMAYLQEKQIKRLKEISQ